MNSRTLVIVKKGRLLDYCPKEHVRADAPISSPPQSPAKEFPAAQDASSASLCSQVKKSNEALDEVQFRLTTIQGTVDEILGRVTKFNPDEPSENKLTGIAGWQSVMEKRVPDILV